jgi:hypothetical protein
MQLGINRIDSVLFQDLDIPELNLKGQAVRVLILGLALCQALGFVCTQLLAQSSKLSSAVPLGIFVGVFLFIVLLGLGYATQGASGESPIQRLVADFYRSFAICSGRTQGGARKESGAASELVSYLLNYGITPQSKLESHLTSLGYTRADLVSALDFLQSRQFVSVRANGVNLLPAKRRLF